MALRSRDPAAGADLPPFAWPLPALRAASAVALGRRPRRRGLRSRRRHRARPHHHRRGAHRARRPGRWWPWPSTAAACAAPAASRCCCSPRSRRSPPVGHLVGRARSSSYVEAGRTLAYLAVFAAGVAAARLAPRSPEIVLDGVRAAAVAVVRLRAGLARLAGHPRGERAVEPHRRAVPVLERRGHHGRAGRARRCSGSARAAPGTLARPRARLPGAGRLHPRDPADPVARRARRRRASPRSPGSRSCPLRLRSLPVLLAPAAAAGAGRRLGAVEGRRSRRRSSRSRRRESVAGDFGLLLLLMIVLLLLVGLAVNAGLARLRRRRCGARRRRRRVARRDAPASPRWSAFTSVAVSDGGLGGSIGDRVDELVSETDTAPEQGAGRLHRRVVHARQVLARGRPRVRRPARCWAWAPGAFEVARLRHRTDAAVTRHAHGYVRADARRPRASSGVALSLALLVAWLAGRARTTGLYPRRLPFRGRAGAAPAPRLGRRADRASWRSRWSAVAFGLQSAIDWTWFVPGPTAMALVAAGYVAGPRAGGARSRAGRPRQCQRGARRSTPDALAAAAGVVLAAVLVAWAIWQPEASRRAPWTGPSTSRPRAGTRRPRARRRTPPTPTRCRPRRCSPAREVAGRRRARAPTPRAPWSAPSLSFPGDPDTWLRLARFQLFTLDRPRARARHAARRALPGPVLARGAARSSSTRAPPCAPR